MVLVLLIIALNLLHPNKPVFAKSKNLRVRTTLGTAQCASALGNNIAGVCTTIAVNKTQECLFATEGRQNVTADRVLLCAYRLNDALL